MKEILICGGGSSGWMTAAALSKFFPDVKITLVESKNIGAIGVGESTLPRINHFLNLIDIKDEDWMPKCDATYKLAIRYTDFLYEGSYYYDVLRDFIRPSFNLNDDKIEIMDFLFLSHLDPDIKLTEFSKFFDETYKMVEENKFTGPEDTRLNWSFKWDKGFHLDANKFGLALKEIIAGPNGVIHIQDDIVRVDAEEDGTIIQIKTKDHGYLKADLYVDCTGFKSLLNFSDYEPFNDFYNDRAITANIPYVDKDKELQVYTNCTALENGWLWNIPIWTRIGAGYVYSSRFVSDEQALVEFKNGLRKIYGDRADDIEPKYIKFQSGVRKEPFHKNVVSIGLSCGFLEPLNSTGLMLAHDNIIRLVSLLSMKDGSINQVDRQVFNKNCRDQFIAMKDFILSRYALAKRNDTEYWKTITQNTNYDIGSTVFSSFSNSIRDYYYNDENSMYNGIQQKALTGMSYNPMPKFVMQKMMESGQINMDRLNEIKDWWNRNQQKQEVITNTLPTLNEYLKQRIYK
jgi:tryptophan halogenase